MTKPLLAILLLLPLSVSAGKGPEWLKMGECSARYWLAGETAKYLGVEITAIELADEIDKSGDAFQAGIDYESEKSSILFSDQIMSEYLDTDAEVLENLNLQELLRLNCHEYLPSDG